MLIYVWEFHSAMELFSSVLIMQWQRPVNPVEPIRITNNFASVWKTDVWNQQLTNKWSFISHLSGDLSKAQTEIKVGLYRI